MRRVSSSGRGGRKRLQRMQRTRAFRPTRARARRGRRGKAHVLDADPFALAVDVLRAGEDVRRREAHRREQRAVGTAAERRPPGLEADAADRLLEVPDDLGERARAGRAGCGSGSGLGLDRAARLAAATSAARARRKATCSSSRSSSKSRTLIRSSIDDAWPSTTAGWTKPSRPSVVSGESRSCGRRSTIAAASLIALTSSPFAQPAWIERPRILSRTWAPENVSSSAARGRQPSRV